MFLPDWVYRMLPFAYIVVGVIVAANMESPIGVGSGIMLTITGLLVWKMRVDFRREIVVPMERKKWDATAHAARGAALRKTKIPNSPRGTNAT